MKNIKRMYENLEFDKVLEILEEQALSDETKIRIKKLEPYLSEAEVLRHLSETTEAKLIIEHYGNPPLSAMKDLKKSLSLIGKGTFLMPEQLEGIAQFLIACRRLKAYLKNAEGSFAAVALYGNSIYTMTEVEEEISQAVRGSQLDDKASPLLSSIRRRIENSEMQIKSKLDSLLRNNKNWFSEGFVAVRNGHYTLPVKREYKNNISGTVIDISQSGSTCFIEPSAVRKLQEEMSLLHIEEENEVRRILFALTALVEENLPFININIETMESLDFVFAKAKLSLAMKAASIPVSSQRKIKIKSGRHPLLKADKVVPLDFYIGGDIQGVVITGPNTGGKTVALKTIGLLSLMAQSGLHVPAEDGYFTMNNYVLCDIGDGQSITENLSTFSSHITNIIEILKVANEESLVLLDELGSGTDPAEGMGLAIAILEELTNKKCLFVTTTHYPEIKDYAKSVDGLINARMAFDRQNLMPLYKLEVGEAGESCALYIAKRLGLPQRMIDRASLAAYGNKSRKGCNNTSGYSESVPNFDIEYSSAAIQKIKKQETKKVSEMPRSMKFNIGDSVIVYPQKTIGIVYKKANEKGEIGVQIKKQKLLINHKRLKLHIPARELYPEDYDFSIIFDTVANRKARHKMESRHNPNLVIESKSNE
ncbi:endonuclease MutS2 [Ruminiclostridium herbifermentans]|nr:DNA mismatch repair protein MutS [Ruminiclostridium herbifermentans]